MLVTDAGRLIRVPADQVRITGRQAMGVTLFRVDAGEHVTSVFPVLEDETDDADVRKAAPRPGGGRPGTPRPRMRRDGGMRPMRGTLPTRAATRSPSRQPRGRKR